MNNICSQRNNFFRKYFSKIFWNIFWNNIFGKKYFFSLCKCGVIVVVRSSLDDNRKFHSKFKIHGFWGNKISINRSKTWKVWIFKVQNFCFLISFFLMCYNYKTHSGMHFPHTSTKIAQTEHFWGVKWKFAILPLKWPLVHMLPCRNCTQMHYYHVYNCNRGRSSHCNTGWSRYYWAIFLIFIFSSALRKQ